MSPKLSGNLDHRGPKSVCIGWLKLPGLSILIAPSATRTTSSMTLDAMPMSEVSERKRKGRKVVGRMMKKESSLKDVLECVGKSDDMLSLKRITSAIETALSSITTVGAQS